MLSVRCIYELNWSDLSSGIIISSHNFSRRLDESNVFAALLLERCATPNNISDSRNFKLVLSAQTMAVFTILMYYYNMNVLWMHRSTCEHGCRDFYRSKPSSH